MDTSDRPRPIRVTLLAILVLIFAAFEGLRLAESIYFYKTLLEYGAPPLYQAISGAVWVAAGLLLVWGLWTGKRWAWLGCLIGAIAFDVWYWIDRQLLQQPHNNGLFAIVASSIILVLVLVILVTRRTRWYLQK